MSRRINHMGGCLQRPISQTEEVFSVRPMTNWTHIAYSGGAANGIMFVGAYRALWESDTIQTLSGSVGTSVGSLFAVFTVLRINPEHVKTEIMNLDSDKLADNSWFAISDIINFEKQLGIYRGDYMHTWVESIISKLTGKDQCTFDDLFKITGRHLKICVFNETKCQQEYWDHITQPNIAISIAIRASSSMPIFYDPVMINENLYIDGGIGDIYPFNAFSNDTTMGVYLLAGNEIKSPQLIEKQIVNDLQSHAQAIYGCIATVQFRLQHANDNWITKTIALGGIGNTQWNTELSNAEKQYWIYQSYAESAKNITWYREHGTFFMN